MLAGLERFVAELRREGIAVSPAEWLDAMRSLTELGLDDRKRFRHTLRCTLVKRASQLPVFDETFERFFSAPGRGGSGRERPGRGAGGQKGRSRGEDGVAGGPRPRPPEREPRTSKKPTDRPGTIEAESVKRSTTALRQGLTQHRGRWRRVIVDRSADEHRKTRERRTEAGVTPRPAERRDFGRSLTLEQERETAAAVPRIVERIRMRTGRRLRRAQRGRLYLRRVFRDNLSHGGVPWVLPFRKPRPRRSRVVLLIDVSWSTVTAAGLFLSIAGEFLRRSRDTRVLLFVDRAVDATREIDHWIARHPTPPVEPGTASGRRRPGVGIVRGGRSFAEVLDELRGLNLTAPSDYGRAFHSLARSRLRPGGRNTALVVLGDGRTNRFDAQDWAFEEIASRCGAVLWLVPEPLDRWGTGDSALGRYLPHTDVAVEARDLNGLARGVSELLRHL